MNMLMSAVKVFLLVKKLTYTLSIRKKILIVILSRFTLHQIRILLNLLFNDKLFICYFIKKIFLERK